LIFLRFNALKIYLSLEKPILLSQIFSVTKLWMMVNVQYAHIRAVVAKT
jgi:hypothetical protein